MGECFFVSRLQQLLFTACEIRKKKLIREAQLNIKSLSYDLEA